MADETRNEAREEITIKFGKGLVEEPFTAKSGHELVEVKIPNQDPTDARSWESFVISPKMIHDNQFGKGVWMKLPADGDTKVSRPVITGQDENGKSIWGRETRTVSNKELKSMLEAYKDRGKDSVVSGLRERSDERIRSAAKPEKVRDEAR